MNTLAYPKEKSRGDRYNNSCSAVVETLRQETQGIPTAPFVMEEGEVLDNAWGKKKVSTHEENPADFTRAESPLLDSSNRLGIALQKQGIINVLKDAEKWKEGEKIENCHKRFMFLVCDKDKCGAPYVLPNSCNSRICPDCGPEIKKRHIAKYRKSFSNLSKYYLDRCKLLTLTTINIPSLDNKGKVFSEIRKAFTKFRHRKPLDKKIFGGLYAIEVTFDEVKGWNIHIHALVSMNYHQVACDGMKKCKDRKEEIKFENDHCSSCENKCLRRIWQECSGSTILDIRKVYDPQEAIIEIIGYITKAFPSAAPKQLVEWWLAMRNKPYIRTFGTKDFTKALKLDFEKPKLLCPWCGGDKFTAHSQGFYTFVDLRGEQGRSPPITPENLSGMISINPEHVVEEKDGSYTVYVMDDEDIREAEYEE